MKKELGQVFTDYKIVKKMLKEIEYNSIDILHKFVLEPSFGDGRILLEIIETYILMAKMKNYTSLEISQQLSTYIYGIEIDKQLYEDTENKIKNLYKKYNLNYIPIHIINGNTLLWNNIVKFDYIIGNPPYVKLTKEEYELYNHYKFANKISNLYILFFEFGFNCLNINGKLIYITPNTYFKTKSQQNLRNDWIENFKLKKIIDYNQSLLFKSAQTYTAITLLTNEKNKGFTFETIKNENISTVEFSYKNDKNLFFNKVWVFKTEKDLSVFDTGVSLNQLVSIKNGCVCGNESIYVINDYLEDNDYLYFTKDNKKYKVEKIFIKNCVKISTYKGGNFYKMIFPYILNSENKYEIVLEKELIDKSPYLYEYLIQYKEILLKRYLLNGMKWYEYTKSQAFNIINTEKLILNKYLLNKNSYMESYIIPKDTIVYSGICMFTQNIPLSILKNEFMSQKFITYCQLYGNDISQAKELSPKIIKNYKIDI